MRYFCARNIFLSTKVLMKNPFRLANSTWQFIAGVGQPLDVDQDSPELELQALEDRVLYDASPLGAVIADVNESIEAMENIDDQIEHLNSLDSFSEATPVMPEENDELLIGESEPVFEQARQLIVIDERVDDVDAFIQDVLNNGQAGIEFDIIRLNPETQGIETITEALRSQGDQRYDAVHIVAHGSDAEIQLGATTLDSNNLHDFQAELSSWTSGLAMGGDILLYGCDVAETEEGQRFVDTIGQWTGADVAASNDLTGHADLGGDWEFEYVVGMVETDLAFSVDVQQNWEGTLASVTVSTFDDVVSADANLNSVGALDNNPGTDGEISLREAIIAANANPNADVIHLGAGTHRLTLTGAAEGDLDIFENVQIIGATNGTTIIDAGALTDERVFDVITGGATFQNLTITGGSTGIDGDSGAGIRINGNTTVVVDNVVVIDNHAAEDGGGIANDGELTVTDSIITGNTAGDDGGGIFSETSSGGLTVTDSTISSNMTADRGGGIFSFNGDVELNRVTVSGNDAVRGGGGIYLGNGSQNLTNVTVSGNQADVGGGVAVFGSSAIADLNNVTIFDNTAIDGGGLANSGADVDVSRSIIAGNHAQSDVLFGNGTIVDSDSIIGNTSGLSLGALADNGGPVETHAILGSVGDGLGHLINGQSPTAGGSTAPPNFDNLDGTPTFVLGGPPVTLDADVTIFDPELSAIDNFDGSVLTVGQFGDRLGSNGVTLATGQAIYVSGTRIGTVATSASFAREIHFNMDATNALVNEFIQSLTYEFVSSNPPSSIDFDWGFDDGMGSPQANGQITVQLVDPTLDLFSGIEINTDGGNNSYLISDTGLPTSLTATTFEIQFRANPDPNEVVFISFNNAAGDEYSIQTTDLNNGLEIDFGPGLEHVSTAIDYPAVLQDGQLHSLAVTWDSVGGDWTIYLDGEEVDSGSGFNSGVALDTTGGQFVFGQEQDGLDSGYTPGQRFDGTIYDVRIWDEVRSETEIAASLQQQFAPTNLPNGLVANWQFGGFDSNGEVVEVVSGNNLSIRNATGPGFIDSTPVDDLIVDENSADGTRVGFVIGSTNGDASAVTYSLTNDAGGRFTIDPDTGEIKVADGDLLNHEANQTHVVAVEVRDNVVGIDYEEDFTITVNDVNEAPVATDDSYITNEDTPLNVVTGGILDNDSDPDNNVGDLVITELSSTSNGALTLNPDGTFEYVPDADFFGTDSFTYQLEDPNGATSAVATVTITVNSVNDAPVATNDNFTINVVTGGILDNDSDPDNNVGDLVVTELSSTSNGALTLNPDGTFDYVPCLLYTSPSPRDATLSRMPSSA